MERKDSKGQGKKAAPDWSELAAKILDLWQDHLMSLAHDPDILRYMQRLMEGKAEPDPSKSRDMGDKKSKQSSENAPPPFFVPFPFHQFPFSMPTFSWSNEEKGKEEQGESNLGVRGVRSKSSSSAGAATSATAFGDSTRAMGKSERVVGDDFERRLAAFERRLNALEGGVAKSKKLPKKSASSSKPRSKQSRRS